MVNCKSFIKPMMIGLCLCACFLAARIFIEYSLFASIAFFILSVFYACFVTYSVKIFSNYKGGADE